MWLPLLPSPSSLLICWCFLCWWVSSSRRYPGVPSFYLLFFMVGLLRAMGVRAEPSLIRTLPSACGLSSLQDEVRTLPGRWAHSPSLGTLPVAGHPPLGGACSLSSLRDEVRTLPGRCTQSLDGWQGEEETGAVASGDPQSAPEGLFLWGKSSCSILWLPLYKEGPVLSHSPPLHLGKGLSRSGSHMAQLSTLPSQCPWSLWVYHFILIPLPATSSNQVSLDVAQALFGRGESP